MMFSAEFMAATEAAKHVIWLQDLISKITRRKMEKTLIRVDNKSAIALSKNPVFTVEANTFTNGFTSFVNKLCKTRDVEHVPGTEQKADILTKALARIKFKEMREQIQVQDLSEDGLKLRKENVG